RMGLEAPDLQVVTLPDHRDGIGIMAEDVFLDVFEAVPPPGTKAVAGDVEIQEDSILQPLAGPRLVAQAGYPLGFGEEFRLEDARVEHVALERLVLRLHP